MIGTLGRKIIFEVSDDRAMTFRDMTRDISSRWAEHEVLGRKPKPEFFHRCFAAIPGFDPAKALMVGDSLTSDIRGGRNAGIRTCWFNPKDKPVRPDIRPDYTVRALEELPPLLETL